MKTNLIILLLIISITTYAQDKIQIGLRAGVNYVNNVYVPFPILEGESQPNDYRIGFHFGFQTRVQLNEKLFLSPEILFNNKGSRSKNIHGSFSDGDGNTQNILVSSPVGASKTHYNYLSIPVFLEYRPTSKLSILAGPELNFLLSAKAKYDNETVNLFDSWDFVGLDHSKFDFGLGIGLEYLLTNDLRIGVRYFHGLSPVVDLSTEAVDVAGYPVDNEDFKNQNRTFQLSLSYVIW